MLYTLSKFCFSCCIGACSQCANIDIKNSLLEVFNINVLNGKYKLLCCDCLFALERQLMNISSWNRNSFSMAQEIKRKFTFLYCNLFLKLVILKKKK